ncbi:c-type cytochrome [Galbibacter mesophilus]|uniref:c-type cytochrome n=1 Tax=Galbibacter mesophilus TaxID=379069 RepID=UPI001F5D0EC6|nr:cytochrome c [Galbibacter mesophilus]MCM5661807.1 cytochrome c [Galbibacter mesophilus]
MLACKTDKKENAAEIEDDHFAPPVSEKTVERTPLSTSIERGGALYNEICMTCHLPNGKGVPNTYPPLDASDWLNEKRKASIRGVKYGIQGPITVNGISYDQVMAPMGLSDQEVADVMNYVMNSWSNKIDEMVTVEEVAEIQEN